MRSREAQERVNRQAAQTVERVEGHAPSVYRMSAERAADNSIADLSRLPAAPRTADDDLQSSTGAFFFLVGYSAVGNGDVIKP